MILVLIACLPRAGVVSLNDPDRARPVLDSGEIDSADTADTGDSADTGDTGDSTETGGSGETGETAETQDTTTECNGIEGFDPLHYTVDSEDTYELITVNLTGCATGLHVNDNGFGNGTGTWTATWLSVPTSFDGEGEALLEFYGGKSTEGAMFFDFGNDQGDSVRFTLLLTP